MRYFVSVFFIVGYITVGFSLTCLAAQPITADAKEDNAPVILIMGDSLSAGFGIDQTQSWANLLRQRLVAESFPHRIVNASISGETSSGGLSRLPSVLKKHRPHIVIIELGANDGMRGQPIKLLDNNLSKMIRLAQDNNSRVLLVGMRLPPNYGSQYTAKFEDTYQQLANENSKIGFAPFLLKGVATQRHLMQGDGIHPVASAQPQLLENIWPHLLPLLHQGPEKK
jgi:acyl-CoA thioesterase-1